MPDDTPTARRRGRIGRPRQGEREAREQDVLDAALAELVENGFDKTTMLSIASRAGASKETLYSWFGNRDGILRALIERSADRSAAQITVALEHPSDPGQTLVDYAVGLLTLLTSPGSIALNRAAMVNPEVGGVLLESGRHRIGPIVERYLAQLHHQGVIAAPDPVAAYQLLYGLIVQDTQIRALLGEAPPDSDQIDARARTAVDHFLALGAG